MKKRALAVLLLTAMLNASCGSAAGSTDTTTASGGNDAETTTISETTKLMPDLPNTDWKGREFRVLGRENPTYAQFNNFEIYAESELGELVNDAVYQRNSVIEEKYKVKITQHLTDQPHALLQSTTLADEDSFDLVFACIEAISAPMLNGYMYDLYNVEHIDFDKPWWNPGVNESVELGGKLFFTSSDFSLRDKNRAYILVHNRDMLKDYGIDPIVDLVREGTWTIDKMTEYSKVVAEDLDGNGMKPVEDRWGLVMDSYDSFALFCYSTGNRILTVKGDTLELTMNTERMVNAVEKISELTCDEDTAFFCNDWDDWYASTNTFVAGNALFSTCFPHSLQNLSADCTFDYGIIPSPKYDEDQEKYLTLADQLSMLFGIPISTPTPEFSGFMLEALSHASTDTTLNAYYETACKVKYVYDPDSAEMLDTIFDGIIYDIGFIMNIGTLKTMITSTIPMMKDGNFSSRYARNEALAKTEIDSMLEQIAALD